jgi:murein DD-endopeptidase MepM/ murein hydrolase activator NlpD
MVTEFGVMRTNQQKGRYAHKAVDLIGLLHCVVWACQDGIVVLKDRYQHSGNTVVIDHGYGILSMYFHLDDFSAIQVGDKIQKGRPLGKMGKTGFANGHHLHWELRVQNIAVDPMQWTKKDFF